MDRETAACSITVSEACPVRSPTTVRAPESRKGPLKASIGVTHCAPYRKHTWNCSVECSPSRRLHRIFRERVPQLALGALPLAFSRFSLSFSLLSLFLSSLSLSLFSLSFSLLSRSG